MKTPHSASAVPVLDPAFVAGSLWRRRFHVQPPEGLPPRTAEIAISRQDGTCFRHCAPLLPDDESSRGLNRRHLERTMKFLLWQKGGSCVQIAGCDELVPDIKAAYAPGGARAFDADIFGRFFSEPFRIEARTAEDLPPPHSPVSKLGGHLDGCRIGFDLGGSDRKCAAVIDGEVVFSEEIPWSPYFEQDPAYHREGIRDSLKRAAAHLPRVDAIGGSAAGVYVNNEVRVASLFRGVAPGDFEQHVRGIFLDLRREWNDIPFEVINDGEVTALAGSMSLHDGALLGISMGTSEAAGYCDSNGNITSWLNELAFAPVDYRENGPVDEWSGDEGCGVQFFSQQGIARLAQAAGYSFPDDTPAAERLVAVQDAMKREDPKARAIFETVGTCFGYALAHYADFYELRHVLILGRVTSGAGGDIIIHKAREALKADFPELEETLSISMPDEKMKRHGQAVAAASLPAIPKARGLS